MFMFKGGLAFWPKTGTHDFGMSFNIHLKF